MINIKPQIPSLYSHPDKCKSRLLYTHPDKCKSRLFIHIRINAKLGVSNRFKWIIFFSIA
ncbi:hypothetical protein B5E53_00425 [Eubacterium sp. An11]|nr:hypothetical protein B5E53_00425 [Eubacterium sp. An11]